MKLFVALSLFICNIGYLITKFKKIYKFATRHDEKQKHTNKRIHKKDENVYNQLSIKCMFILCLPWFERHD
jgi:hypothetical protein